MRLILQLTADTTGIEPLIDLLQLFALVYSGLGEQDQAFAWLEKAYEEHSGALPYLKVNPSWDPLRSDPRFGRLVTKVFSGRNSTTQLR
jgi:hypothetical protein